MPWDDPDTTVAHYGEKACGTDEEMAAKRPEMRRYQIQQAVHILGEAKKIRDDAGLMAEIRVALREERDRLSLVIDDLGTGKTA